MLYICGREVCVCVAVFFFFFFFGGGGGWIVRRAIMETEYYYHIPWNGRATRNKEIRLFGDGEEECREEVSWEGVKEIK